MTATRKNMSVELRTHLGASLTETPTVALGDWKAASETVRAYITRLGLGASEWSGGVLKNARGKAVAHVTYDGRVWHKDPAKGTDAVLLYDPASR